MSSVLSVYGLFDPLSVRFLPPNGSVIKTLGRIFLPFGVYYGFRRAWTMFQRHMEVLDKSRNIWLCVPKSAWCSALNGVCYFSAGIGLHLFCQVDPWNHLLLNRKLILGVVLTGLAKSSFYAAFVPGSRDMLTNWQSAQWYAAFVYGIFVFLPMVYINPKSGFFTLPLLPWLLYKSYSTFY